MPRSHIALVTSDGQVLISGPKGLGQKAPHLPIGVGYSSVAVGGFIAGTLFLRTDGKAETCKGAGCHKDFQAPPLPDNVHYVMGAAGNSHYVFLRNDGQAVAVHYGGDDVHCLPPVLPEGVTYTSVAAGEMHTILVRSDGQAVALNARVKDEWKEVPAPPAGILYTSAAGGLCHSVLVRDDGKAVEFGHRFDGVVANANDTRSEQLYFAHNATCIHDFGEGRLLEAPTGSIYVETAAGGMHTVLVRSDGCVDAFGDNTYGQCSVPCCPEGVTYVSAAAGDLHTVLIRSDGQAVAFGTYVFELPRFDETHEPPVQIGGTPVVPKLPDGVRFVESGSADTIAVQIETKDTGKQVEMSVKSVASGLEVATLRFSKNRFKAEKICQLYEAIASKIGIPVHQLKVLLPNFSVLELKDYSKKMNLLIPEDSSKLNREAAAADASQSALVVGYNAASMPVAAMSAEDA